MRKAILAVLLSAAVAASPVEAAEPEFKKGSPLVSFGIFYFASIAASIGIGWMAKKVVDLYQAEDLMQRTCTKVSDTEMECDIVLSAKLYDIDCRPADAGKVRCKAEPHIIEKLD